MSAFDDNFAYALVSSNNRTLKITGVNPVKYNALNTNWGAMPAIPALYAGPTMTYNGYGSPENAYYVVEIADGAFNGRTEFAQGTLSLPSTIQRIGDYAFNGVKFIGRLTIPSSVAFIGTQAFSNTLIDELIVENETNTDFLSGVLDATRVASKETVARVATDTILNSVKVPKANPELTGVTTIPTAVISAAVITNATIKTANIATETANTAVIDYYEANVSDAMKNSRFTVSSVDGNLLSANGVNENAAAIEIVLSSGVYRDGTALVSEIYSKLNSKGIAWVGGSTIAWGGTSFDPNTNTLKLGYSTDAPLSITSVNPSPALVIRTKFSKTGVEYDSSRLLGASGATVVSYEDGAFVLAYGNRNGISFPLSVNLNTPTISVSGTATFDGAVSVSGQWNYLTQKPKYNAQVLATESYVDSRMKTIKGESLTSTVNTLAAIASAINEDPAFAVHAMQSQSTILNSITSIASVRSTAVSSLSTALSMTTSTLQSIDISISGGISNIIPVRSSQMDSVSTSLNTTVSSLQSVDLSISSALSGRISERVSAMNSLSAAGSTSASLLQNADNSISTGIANDSTTRSHSISSISTSLVNVVYSLQTVDATLSNAITTASTVRSTDVSYLSSILSGTVPVLQTVDGAFSGALTQQTANRVASVTSLSGAVSAQISTTQSMNAVILPKISSGGLSQDDTTSTVFNLLGINVGDSLTFVKTGGTFATNDKITIMYSATDYLKGTVTGVSGSNVTFTVASKATSAVESTIYTTTGPFGGYGSFSSYTAPLSVPLFDSAGNNYVITNMSGVVYSPNGPGTYVLNLLNGSNAVLGSSNSNPYDSNATSKLSNFKTAFVPNNQTLQLQFILTGPIGNLYVSFTNLGAAYTTMKGYAVPYSSGSVRIDRNGALQSTRISAIDGLSSTILNTVGSLQAKLTTNQTDFNLNSTARIASLNSIVSTTTQSLVSVQSVVSTLASTLASATTVRSTSVSSLSTMFSTNVSSLSSAIAAHSTALSTQISNRSTQVLNAINTLVGGAPSSLDTLFEIATALDGGPQLYSMISNTETTLTAETTARANDVGSVAGSLATAVVTLQSVDAVLSSGISTAISARLSGVSSASTVLSTAVSTLQSVDTVLSTGISTATSARLSGVASVSGSLLTAVSTLQSGNSVLSTDISTATSARLSGVASVSSALLTAVSTLQSVDTVLSGGISTATSDRLSGVASVSGSLSATVSSHQSVMTLLSTSFATLNAGINLSLLANTTAVDSAINGIVGANAISAMDTLNEIAVAMNNNAGIGSALDSMVSAKGAISVVSSLIDNAATKLAQASYTTLSATVSDKANTTLATQLQSSVSSLTIVYSTISSEAHSLQSNMTVNTQLTTQLGDTIRQLDTLYAYYGLVNADGTIKYKVNTLSDPTMQSSSLVFTIDGNHQITAIRQVAAVQFDSAQVIVKYTSRGIEYTLNPIALTNRVYTFSIDSSSIADYTANATAIVVSGVETALRLAPVNALTIPKLALSSYTYAAPTVQSPYAATTWNEATGKISQVLRFNFELGVQKLQIDGTTYDVAGTTEKVVTLEYYPGASGTFSVRALNSASKLESPSLTLSNVYNDYPQYAAPVLVGGTKTITLSGTTCTYSATFSSDANVVEVHAYNSGTSTYSKVQDLTPATANQFSVSMTYDVSRIGQPLFKLKAATSASKRASDFSTVGNCEPFAFPPAVISGNLSYTNLNTDPKSFSVSATYTVHPLATDVQVINSGTGGTLVSPNPTVSNGSISITFNFTEAQAMAGMSFYVRTNTNSVGLQSVSDAQVLTSQYDVPVLVAGTKVLSVSKFFSYSNATTTFPYTLSNFPVLGSLSSWDMSVNFRSTGKEGFFRAIVGAHEYSPGARGWGLWINTNNRILWAWLNWGINPDISTSIIVSTNVNYYLKITKTTTTIQFVLTNLDDSTMQSQTINHSNATIGTTGTVTIGGWIYNTSDNFVGIISNVDVGPYTYTYTANYTSASTTGVNVYDATGTTVLQTITGTSPFTVTQTYDATKIGQTVFRLSSNMISTMRESALITVSGEDIPVHPTLLVSGGITYGTSGSDHTAQLDYTAHHRVDNLTVLKSDLTPLPAAASFTQSILSTVGTTRTFRIMVTYSNAVAPLTIVVIGLTNTYGKQSAASASQSLLVPYAAPTISKTITLSGNTYTHTATYTSVSTAGVNVYNAVKIWNLTRTSNMLGSFNFIPTDNPSNVAFHIDFRSDRVVFGYYNGSWPVLNTVYDFHNLSLPTAFTVSFNPASGFTLTYGPSNTVVTFPNYLNIATLVGVSDTVKSNWYEGPHFVIGTAVLMPMGTSLNPQSGSSPFTITSKYDVSQIGQTLSKVSSKGNSTNRESELVSVLCEDLQFTYAVPTISKTISLIGNTYTYNVTCTSVSPAGVNVYNNAKTWNMTRTSSSIGGFNFLLTSNANKISLHVDFRTDAVVLASNNGTSWIGNTVISDFHTLPTPTAFTVSFDTIQWTVTYGTTNKKVYFPNTLGVTTLADISDAPIIYGGIGTAVLTPIGISLNPQSGLSPFTFTPQTYDVSQIGQTLLKVSSKGDSSTKESALISVLCEDIPTHNAPAIGGITYGTSGSDNTAQMNCTVGYLVDTLKVLKPDGSALPTGASFIQSIISTTGASRVMSVIVTFTHSVAPLSVAVFAEANAYGKQSAASATQPLLGALVASYSFDSNGTDSCGNNNLTNVSAVTFNASDFKRGSGAASFNGNNYFQIANDGRFSPDNFTLAFWIKPVAGSVYQAIASCRNSPGPNLAGWIIYLNSNNLEFWTGNASSWSGNDVNLLSGFGNVNTWVHLCFTLNKSTGSLQVYVNGTLYTTVSRTYVNNATTNLRIGAGANEQGASFNVANGTLIDDFRFYNKVLSAAEIASLCGEEFPVHTTPMISGVITYGTSGSDNTAQIKHTVSSLVDTVKVLKPDGSALPTGASFTQSILSTTGASRVISVIVTFTNSVAPLSVAVFAEANAYGKQSTASATQLLRGEYAPPVLSSGITYGESGGINTAQMNYTVSSDVTTVDVAKPDGSELIDGAIFFVNSDFATQLAQLNKPENINKIFRTSITGSSIGSVYGTNTYTADSNISKTAVHAGILAVGETKMVHLKIVAPINPFVGSTRNGITSSTYNNAYYYLNSTMGLEFMPPYIAQTIVSTNAPSRVISLTISYANSINTAVFAMENAYGKKSATSAMMPLLGQYAAPAIVAGTKEISSSVQMFPLYTTGVINTNNSFISSNVSMTDSANYPVMLSVTFNLSSFASSGGCIIGKYLLGGSSDYFIYWDITPVGNGVGVVFRMATGIGTATSNTTISGNTLLNGVDYTLSMKRTNDTSLTFKIVNASTNAVVCSDQTYTFSSTRLNNYLITGSGLSIGYANSVYAELYYSVAQLVGYVKNVKIEKNMQVLNYTANYTSASTAGIKVYDSTGTTLLQTVTTPGSGTFTVSQSYDASKVGQIAFKLSSNSDSSNRESALASVSGEDIAVHAAPLLSTVTYSTTAASITCTVSTGATEVGILKESDVSNVYSISNPTIGQTLTNFPTLGAKKTWTFTITTALGGGSLVNASNATMYPFYVDFRSDRVVLSQYNGSGWGPEQHITTGLHNIARPTTFTVSFDANTFVIGHATNPQIATYTTSQTITSIDGINDVPNLYGLTYTGPVVNRLSTWEMRIAFNSTSRNNAWRALVGNMRNPIIGSNGRGWGMWISGGNNVYFSWSASESVWETLLSVELNTEYVVVVNRTPSSMTIALTNMSTNVTNTAVNNSMSSYIMSANGPVTVGGWISDTTENFVGPISSVIVYPMIASAAVSGTTAVVSVPFANLNLPLNVVAIAKRNSKGYQSVASATQTLLGQYAAPTITAETKQITSFLIVNPANRSQADNFPALGSLASWDMSIYFKATGGASSWRGLVGAIYNGSGRNWGVWISSGNNVHWGWATDNTYTTLPVALNVNYYLKITKTTTTIKMDLTNLDNSTTASETYNHANLVMGTSGPVTIGGWNQDTNEIMIGSISAVSVGLYSLAASFDSPAAYSIYNVANQVITPTDVVLPNKFILRTGTSNWRQYVPLTIANESADPQGWGPDGQFNTSYSGNFIATQFSYFATYWLTRLKIPVGEYLSIEAYAYATSVGVFIFGKRITDGELVGRLSKYNSGQLYTLVVQPDAVNAANTANATDAGIISRTANGLPDQMVLRLGNTDWKQYVPLTTASLLNGISWGGVNTGQDEQFYTDYGPPNYIAQQFSYFAHYWLNRLRVPVGKTMSVPAIAAQGAIGIFSFWKHNASTIKASLSTYNSGATYDMPAQTDAATAGVAAQPKYLLSSAYYTAMVGQPIFKLRVPGTASLRDSEYLIVNGEETPTHAAPVISGEPVKGTGSTQINCTVNHRVSTLNVLNSDGLALPTGVSFTQYTVGINGTSRIISITITHTTALSVIIFANENEYGKKSASITQALTPSIVPYSLDSLIVHKNSGSAIMPSPTGTGVVRTYNSTWANDVNLTDTSSPNTSGNNHHGVSIEMSLNGEWVVVGSPHYDNNVISGSNYGRSVVYRRNNINTENWVLAFGYTGTYANAAHGTAVSIAGDGSVYAASEPNYNSNQGMIRVFVAASGPGYNDFYNIRNINQYTALKYDPFGVGFDPGQTAEAGYGLSFSGTGRHLAITSNRPGHYSAGNVCGVISTYRIDQTETVWCFDPDPNVLTNNYRNVYPHSANDIVGADSSTRLGAYVKLSTDGTKLIATTETPLSVRVYTRTFFESTPATFSANERNNWSLVFSKEEPNMLSTTSVTMSQDGNRFAITTKYISASVPSMLKVYNMTDSTNAIRTFDFTGFNSAFKMGFVVSFSADGNVISVAEDARTDGIAKIFVWDVNTGNAIGNVIEAPKNNSGWNCRLSMSVDGTRFVMSDPLNGDGIVRIYRIPRVAYISYITLGSGHATPQNGTAFIRWNPSNYSTQDHAMQATANGMSTSSTTAIGTLSIKT